MPRLAVISAIYALTLLFTCKLHGQAHNILIENYSLEDGLSNSSVLDIHQDKFGFLWFATEHGLNRFDGKDFKVYRYNPDDPSTIKANYVKRIFEDPWGNIWVLYGVGGMSKLDRSTGKFVYFTFNRSQPSHPNNSINSLYWEEDGSMWISTQNGLNQLAIDSLSYKRVPINCKDFDTSNLSVKYVFNDKSNRLWVMTSSGFFELKKDGYQLLPATRFGTDEGGLIDGNIWRISQNKKEDLFVGSNRGGVFRFEENLGSFEHLKVQSNATELITCALFSDEGNQLWAGFRGGGLFRLDMESMTFFPDNAGHDKNLIYAFADSSGGIWSLSRGYKFYYQKDKNSPAVHVDPFPNEETAPIIYAITVDEKGNIWAGTNSKGIVKFETETPYFNHISDFRNNSKSPASNPFVTAIAHGESGKLWVGTKNGLKCYDKSQNRFIPLDMVSPILKEFENTGIRALFIDDQQRLFISNYNGLSILDFSNSKMKIINAGKSHSGNQQLSSNGVSAIVEIGNGKYWIATDNGLDLYDSGNNTITSFFHNAKVKTSLSNHSVSCLLIDSNETLWAGTIAGGLNRLTGWENDNPEFQHYTLQSKHENPSHKLMTVNVLMEDNRDNIWVGTYSRGLLRYDKKSDKLLTIPTTDGLPIPNISGILQDEHGFLWISSNDGLARYDPVDHSFLHFNEDDGIQSLEFNARACSKGKDGCLYFGGINGFNEFHPGKVILRPKPEKPIITGFSLFGEPKYFEKQIQEIEKLELDHGQNFLAFNFISLDYKNPEKLQYDYYLENLETGWKRGGKSGQASYANLFPGEYIFHVKATNYEGRSSEPTSILLVIEPPYWQKTWFIASVCFILLGILYAIHVFRIRLRMGKIREIERIREKAAADFHDELGHRLTKISLFTEMIFRTGKPDGDLAKYLEKIRENSNGLYHSMRDFIWAMNPKKDSIFELGILLKDFGDDLFDKTRVNFRVHGIEENQKQVKLNMDWKRHLVLMFKEAMHNTLKHAGCQNATLEISLAEKELTIELKDDGMGFVRDDKGNGYGIGNMYTRAKKLNGNLEIESLLEKGTKIRFTGLI